MPDTAPQPPGRVVILNGVSSSGKTSIARRFRDDRAERGDCWLVIGIDDYYWLLPHQWFEGGGHHGPFSAEGVQLQPRADGIEYRAGPLGRRLFATYRRTAATWARGGFNVLVDEVLLDDHDRRDWETALDGLTVTWVAVRCDPDVAEARERARGDRMPGMARGLGSIVHAGVDYDFELDTTSSSAAESAARLSAFLHGTG
ncbi:MAG TPA: hypothetical protein VKR22_13225 [Acidimicrobiales bacterium]|nr:hypothetical protein [Acidimicrobiales bacterium]